LFGTIEAVPFLWCCWPRSFAGAKSPLIFLALFGPAEAVPLLQSLLPLSYFRSL
jgi:hypothetical protein